MPKEQEENQILVKEIDVTTGKKVSVLIGSEGLLCYRHGAIGQWEPCGEDNYRVALALNRGVLIRP